MLPLASFNRKDKDSRYSLVSLKTVNTVIFAPISRIHAQGKVVCPALKAHMATAEDGC